MSSDIPKLAETNVIPFQGSDADRTHTLPLAPRVSTELKISPDECLRAVKAFMEVDDPQIRRLFVELMERVSAVTRSGNAETSSSA